MIRMLSFMYPSSKPAQIGKMPIDTTLDPRKNGFKPVLQLTVMSHLTPAWTP